jgi:hypothetical protein
MSDTRQPPPHVAEAAKIVDEWLRGQPGAIGTGAPQRRETAAERFAKMPRADVPPVMPAWQKPE